MRFKYLRDHPDPALERVLLQIEEQIASHFGDGVGVVGLRPLAEIFHDHHYVGDFRANPYHPRDELESSVQNNLKRVP